MSSRIAPIKPEDIAKQKQEDFPDEVIRVFNELIAAYYYNGSATVRQDEAVGRMVQSGLSQNEIFRNGWLNVEEIYRAQGWDVHYEKPAYNEPGAPIFTFSSKKKSE